MIPTQFYGIDQNTTLIDCGFIEVQGKRQGRNAINLKLNLSDDGGGGELTQNLEYFRQAFGLDLLVRFLLIYYDTISP